MFGLGDLFNATPAIRKTSYLRNLPGWTLASVGKSLSSSAVSVQLGPRWKFALMKFIIALWGGGGFFWNVEWNYRINSEYHRAISFDGGEKKRNTSTICNEAFSTILMILSNTWVILRTCIRSLAFIRQFARKIFLKNCTERWYNVLYLGKMESRNEVRACRTRWFFRTCIHFLSFTLIKFVEVI